MKKLLIAGVALSSLMALPTATYAQDDVIEEEVVKPKTPKDWFVYGDANIASAQFSTSEGNTTFVSDSFTAAYFRAGVKYKYVGLEGEIGTGLSGIEENGISADISSQTSVFGILRFPADNYDIFLRAGYHSTDIDVSGDAFNDVTGAFEPFELSESSDGVAIGVGGTYYFTDNFGIRADITGYNTRDIADANFVAGSIGGSVKF